MLNSLPRTFIFDATMLSGASHNLFTGGTYNVHNVHVQGTTIGGFERLQQAVSPGAFHDAGDTVDPPKCHPNTRTAVINRIMDWILGRLEEGDEANILWFHGPAGSGKSAIARKIAELCESEKRLLATFFFSRSDPARGNAKSLIATIAYQIAINLPRIKEKIVATIERDPLLLTRSLESQSVALIVEPLRALIKAKYLNTKYSRRLIIIDGLDECDTPDIQREVLNIFSFFFQKYRLPLRILVSSRAERHLTHSFSTGSLPKLYTTLALDNNYQPERDIRLFLTDNFRVIKATHPMRHYIDHSWPSPDVLKGLVQKSSGQFIYASTAVKYVSSIRHNPTDRLNVVLGIRPPHHAREMPFSELDALYRHIFSSLDDADLVLRILGVRLLSPLDVRCLERFLLLNRGDIEMLIGNLSSIITISHNSYIHILHASLGDFLFDATRSREFFIDRSSIHTMWNTTNLFLIDSASNNGGHFGYAAHHLVWHCENTPLSASAELREEIMNFPLHRPDSCFARPEDGVSLFYLVPELLHHSTTRMKFTIKDSKKFSVSSHRNSHYITQALD
ncbi:hypothetical protein M413DRAFT_32597 [Hebeloma cylindrosporum]|uniref:Nephrocystin 3-like N-terminal domain-containing protein n=1 Tax=Hebeloma cylindrosporum TaxID=76867 RepID=A0A0C3BEU2_HEBCY|nr:hypothetical protein M413DRAFT_32597 [Hebeloma cylindrosporum h7]